MIDCESDSQQFGELLTQQFRQHSALFFKLAHGIVRDVNLAEDACQQAMTKAWEHRGRINDKLRLRAWLARTVANEALQMVRRRGTEKRVLGSLQANGETLESEEEQFALREAILHGLSQIAEPARTIVTLRLVDQMSGNQVSELLSCSPAEVSRQLHGGMKQLQQILKLSQVEIER